MDIPSESFPERFHHRLRLLLHAIKESAGWLETVSLHRMVWCIAKRKLVKWQLLTSLGHFYHCQVQLYLWSVMSIILINYADKLALSYLGWRRLSLGFRSRHRYIGGRSGSISIIRSLAMERYLRTVDTK